MELGFHGLGFSSYPSPFTNYFMHLGEAGSGTEVL